MNEFLQANADRRQVQCERAGGILGLSPASIEKDFWVCWTLSQLFDLPKWGPALTFKGGTSLSKAWGLIERFSEDIDIVIDRHMLGYIEGEPGESGKQRRKRLDALKSAAQGAIRDEILPLLQARIRSALPSENGWKIESDLADADLQTLLFTYPSAFVGRTGYVRPVVKIEMGARSDTEPVETVSIRPYVFTDLTPDSQSECSVRALAARRTFWEKAMLLHEENHRPAGKVRKQRLARHYYDLWCLITRGIADQATADEGLFERVLAHREVFFRWSWMDYTTMRRGSLRVVPPAEQLKDWAADYQAMGTEMFFGPVPDFDEVMKTVGDFERRFNGSSSSLSSLPPPLSLPQSPSSSTPPPPPSSV
jgi:hypothetical protein